MSEIFSAPEERGRTEWQLFRAVRNDLRPISELLLKALDPDWRRQRHTESMRDGTELVSKMRATN